MLTHNVGSYNNNIDTLDLVQPSGKCSTYIIFTSLYYIVHFYGNLE